MASFETVDDLVEEICDSAGIYNDPRCTEPLANFECDDARCPDAEFAVDGTENADGGAHCDLEFAPTDGYEVAHVERCFCRVNFAPRLAERLRRALENERKLESVGLFSTGAGEGPAHG